MAEQTGAPRDEAVAETVDELASDSRAADESTFGEVADGEDPDGFEAAVSGRDPAFEELLVYLREQRGFDFTGYKRPSLVRRVRRRIGEVGISSLADYQDFLELHPEEFAPLFNTILINVTSFFRDRPSWDHLRERLLPEVLANAGPAIRVWSAGCASGQEAYSLAIVLAEALGIEQFRERVKIYATDVDEDALAQARQAVFTEREMSGLTPEEVETWFQPEGSRFTFRKDLRRSVIFGRNDLVQDAPISHVDLLLCRNTLMYFNADTQNRILGRLHFALEPHGVLFLGKAEMLLSHPQLFAPVDLTRRFFRKRDGARSPDRRLVPPVLQDLPGGQESEFARVRQEATLAAPAAQLALDAGGRLAMVNHQAERLFRLHQRDIGRPFQDLEVSYRPVELRAAVAEAAEARRPVWLRGIERHEPGQESSVLDVQVVPLHREDGALLGTSVVFEDVTRYRRLQTELEYANRQLETAYEELQSTNEELETMNEELQSMNDELHATNEELRVSTEEVGALNRFMFGVMSSFRAGVVVVDSHLRVLVWNAAAEDLWGLRQEEVQGQYVLNLDIGLPISGLHPLLRRQVSGQAATHETLEVDAVNRRGRPVRVRITVSAFSHESGERGGAVVLMDPTAG